MPAESYQHLLRAPASSLVLQSFQLLLKGLNTIDRLRNKNKYQGIENASDVRLTRKEPRHNTKTQNNSEMKLSHTNLEFVVETSPVFAAQNLRLLSSTTRFHSPLYPPLNNVTPLKVLFPYQINAPLLRFLFHLRTLSSPTFYQQFLSTINLPYRHILSLSSSRPLCLSPILPASYLIFFLFFPFFPHLFLSLTSIFSFISLSCQECFSPFSSLSPLFSNLSTPSKNFLRRLRISCPLFFFPCWFSSVLPLFLSLLVWRKLKGTLNICRP